MNCTSHEHSKITFCVLVEFCETTALGGHVVKQGILTGETIQDNHRMNQITLLLQ